MQNICQANTNQNVTLILSSGKGNIKTKKKSKIKSSPYKDKRKVYNDFELGYTK